MNKLIVVILMLLFSGVSMANDFINIKKLTKQAVIEIRSQFKIDANHRLDLIDINIHKKEHNLSSTFLQLVIGDLDSRTKGEYSENVYKTYSVRLSLTNGKIVEIVESGLETYKVMNDEIMQ